MSDRYIEYATKEYVDDIVANIEGEGEGGNGLPLLSSICMKNEDGSLFKKGVYYCLDFNLIPKDVTETYYDDISTSLGVLYSSYLVLYKDDNLLSSSLLSLRSAYPFVSVGYRTGSQTLCFGNSFQSITYNLETNTRTVEEIYSISSKAPTSSVLTKTNTEEYTPTADYQPATKKYVDEAVDNIGTGSNIDTNNLVVTNSISIGRKEGTTIGEKSVAVGNNVEASSYYSHAEGSNTKASGYASHAEGHYSEASGDYSHAEGFATTASGEYSHAEGARTIASSEYQHVQGRFNIEDSTNTYAHIVGNGEDIETDEGEQVIYSNAHTLDWNGNAWYAGDVYVGGTSQDTDSKKLATEEYVDALTNNVLVKSEQTLSNAEKDQVRKNLGYIGRAAVAGEQVTVDDKTYTVEQDAEIFGDYATNIAIGAWSIAEGSENIAVGRATHVEGAMNKGLGTGCHVEGVQCTASGYWSHAEGERTIVTSYASHAEGSYTTLPDGTTRYGTADGYASHIEGGGCHASGSCSHAEGLATTVSGNHSHVEGRWTVAASSGQHVEGTANIEDTEGKYIHIAGNGSWDNGEAEATRSNAYTLDWDGNGWFAGDLYVGGTSQDTGNKLATEAYIDNIVGSITIDEDELDAAIADILN